MTTEPAAPLEPSVPVEPGATPGITVPLAPPNAARFHDAPSGIDPAFAPATADPLPRIRWAGIVWGAFFAAVASLGLWTLADASRREAIHDWLLTLSPSTVSPGAVVGFSLLALGILLLVAGGVALLRRAQVRATIER